MARIQTLRSKIPALAGDEDLARVAYDLQWSWNPEHKRALAARLGLDALNDDANPLAKINRRPLAAGGHDAIADVAARLRSTEREGGTKPKVAYLCAEFGLHPSLPIYSGGLGILAGDHLKAASDIGLDLVGVGLLYRRGYFRQTLDERGQQEHHKDRVDLAEAPVLPVDDGHGAQLTVDVRVGAHNVRAGVWLARVGRVPLLLLDADRDDNDAAVRGITHSLYVGDRESRLAQELVLGVGGLRALRALDLEPEVYHLNEGHSALSLLERIGRARAAGLSTSEAVDQISKATVFTIHTPVPAGNEVFDGALFARLAGPVAREASLDDAELFALGKGKGDGGQFDMTAFCLRVARATNGVSLLHGETAKSTWSEIARAPVRGLTNGVHLPTWLGAPMQDAMCSAGVLAREDGTLRFLTTSLDEIRDQVDQLDDDVWKSARAAQRAALSNELDVRLFEARTRHGRAPSDDVAFAIKEGALVLGFARRFATYKRANLILRDPGRLERILAGGVQLIFAGKAHPKDEPGLALIAELVRLSKTDAFSGNLLVLEGYDIPLGKRLTQGVDVWLNNPKRPLEASGTSGMKAAMNGVPNLSILDGWWDEGFSGDNGWAIGDRDSGDDDDDAAALYDVLENQVLSAWRDGGAFLAHQKRATATSLWAFSTRRMVGQYDAEVYST